MAHKSPCKGCEKRTVTCHGVCREYESWKNEVAAEKAFTREQNMVTVSDSVVRSHWKNIKYRRRKKINCGE